MADQKIRHAIQRMVARARVDNGPMLRDFSIILPSDVYSQLLAQLREEHEGHRVGSTDFVVLNTANGPMKVYCRKGDLGEL